MDREKYIQMRKSGQYDLAWYYQYYLQEKGEYSAYDFQAFAQAFNMYFQFDMRQILEGIDKKMGVTKIEDNNGNLIYIN
jgi:hypothetical protein